MCEWFCSLHALLYEVTINSDIVVFPDPFFLLPFFQEETQKDQVTQMQRRNERKKEKRKKSARLQVQVQEEGLDLDQPQEISTDQTETETEAETETQVQLQPTEPPLAQTERPQKTVIKAEAKTLKASVAQIVHLYFDTCKQIYECYSEIIFV